jgi:hypothetical protein
MIGDKTMSETSELLIGLVSDEANLLRQKAEGYFNIHTEQDEDLEMMIDECDQRTRLKWLRTLHAPISGLGLTLTDDDRHYLFSRLFGRNIKTAGVVTNIEAWAWSRVAKYNQKLIYNLVKDIISERNTTTAIV